MAKRHSLGEVVEPLHGPPVSKLDEMIIEAAWLYYHQEMNQSEISKKLGLSRASVVNYLAEARQRGWVRLYLDSDVFLNHRLSADLCAAFGLKAALVVGGADESSGAGARVSLAAAQWLPKLLSAGDRLGVSWGETIYRMAQKVPRHQIADLQVVQLLGSRPASWGFSAESCTALMAQQLGALSINLHVPLLLSQETLADQLRREPIVEDQLRSIANCNKTVFACGTCGAEAHVVRSGLLDAEALAPLRARGAVGVICGRLIDAQGAPVVAEFERRMIGVSLDQMRGKDLALLVATGAERTRPALAAIRGGFVTHLATSARIARELLSLQMCGE